MTTQYSKYSNSKKFIENSTEFRLKTIPEPLEKKTHFNKQKIHNPFWDIQSSHKSSTTSHNQYIKPIPQSKVIWVYKFEINVMIKHGVYEKHNISKYVIVQWISNRVTTY